MHQVRCSDHEPESTDGTSDRTPLSARYGTVFVTARLASGLDGTMSIGREIRSYDYVNRPYERVRDALRQNALRVFQSATKTAASRAQCTCPPRAITLRSNASSSVSRLAMA